MAIGYTQILLLCFSALIIHVSGKNNAKNAVASLPLPFQWTNTATLHSSLHSSTTKLLRRQNPSSAQRDDANVPSVIYRSKRWPKAKDHDEIEIPTDETNVTASVSTDGEFSVESTLNTSINEVSDHSRGQSSLVEEILQDTDLNTNGNFSRNDSFPSSTLFTEISSSYFTSVNESLELIVANRTSEDVSDMSTDSSSTRILFNLTTISYSIPSENQTDEEYPISNERVLNATNNSIQSLKDTFVSDHDTDNLTQTNAFNVKTVAVLDTSDNETVPSSRLICDETCQCSKECPYGFEILNDTCECYPPCQVSHCDHSHPPGSIGCFDFE
jgi:hypothetical protein